MVSPPNLPTLPSLPALGGQPMTYPQLLRTLSCVCAGGAQIKPSTPPSATINIGDIIADQSKLLGALAAGYSILAVVMQLINCIKIGRAHV